jgi:hypothetical protein
MISIHAMESNAPLSPLAAEMFSDAAEAQKVSLFLDYAEYCGLQENLPGLPSIELWTLRKPLGHHPKGSTVTRATMERYLFPLSGKYGSTTINADDPAIKAVETPLTNES